MRWLIPFLFPFALFGQQQMMLQTYSASAPSGPTLPSDVQGLYVWADAGTNVFTDAGTTPAADGETVAQWNDNTANGWHFTQASASSKPVLVVAALNGRNVISFDATNDHLTNYFGGVTNDHPITVITVSRLTNAAAVTRYYFDGRNSRLILSATSSGGLSISAGTALVYAGGNAGEWTVKTLVFNTTTSSARTNGVSMGAAGDCGTRGVDGFYLNMSNVKGGLAGLQIAEFCVWTNAISDANRNAIESYLMTKYGL